MVVVVSVVAIAAPVVPAAAQAAGFVQNIGALTLQTPGGFLLTMSAWELLIVGTDIHSSNNTTDAAANGELEQEASALEHRLLHFFFG